MTANDFFSSIESFSDFKDVFDAGRYRPLPPDWLVVACDIQGSTEAIQGGKYKEINIVGASAIIAVLNAVMGVEIPYVFGGDGASFAIPLDAAAPVAAALSGTRDMAVNVFGLTLRTGIIPVTDVRAAGYDIKVARYSLSEKVAIAMFDGGGLAHVESVIKDQGQKDRYDIQKWTKLPPLADFSGLECRWNPLRTAKGEIVTLIARAAGADSLAIYSELFGKIQSICGTHGNYRPARAEALNLSFNLQNLKHEYRVRTQGKSFLGRALYALKMGYENLVGTVIFSREIKGDHIDGKNYVRDLVKNTDFQKFDDTLRMVIDNTPAQTAELVQYLEDQHKNGKLFYGTHVEQEALITCLIFDRADRHLHFVDGARGGYAAASRAMKEQILGLESPAGPAAA
jgi:hypothetical protein